jgi:hypothetical protein
MLRTLYRASFRSFSTCTSKRTVFDASCLKPLQQYAPTFYTNGENIKPLYQPADFYSQLKVNFESKMHPFHSLTNSIRVLVEYSRGKRTRLYCCFIYWSKRTRTSKETRLCLLDFIILMKAYFNR